jgi:hypothetical protein
MSRNLIEGVDDLNVAVKNYIHAKLNLIKLTVLEKAARTITLIYVLMVVLFFALIIVAVGVAAFAVWYGERYNDYVAGLLFGGGGLILVALLLILIGKHFLSNSIIRNFSEKLFRDNKN